MTDETKGEQEEQEQDFTPPKWKNCIPVKVSKIVLERTGKDNEFVKRVRLETDLGNITHKPKKRVTQKTVIDGFETEDTEMKLFTTQEFKQNNPMLLQLNKDKTEKKPKEITLSYAETTGKDDSGEIVYYKYMLHKQWVTIFYDGYHTDTTETLDKQKEAQEKYKKNESDL